MISDAGIKKDGIFCYVRCLNYFKFLYILLGDNRMKISMLQFIKALSVIVIAIFITGASTDKNSGLNSILGIDVTHDQNACLITIKGNTTPNYSVFKLPAPPKIIIDFIDTDIQRLSPIIKSSNKFVSQIATTQFADSTSLIGRLAVELKDQMMFDVSANGNDTIISIYNESVQISSLKNNIKTEKQQIDISDVNFTQQGEISRIVLNADSTFDYRIEQGENNETLMTISNASLSADLFRSLDTSAYGGVVNMVSSYQPENNETEVKILVETTSDKVTQELVYRNGEWHWDFSNETNVKTEIVDNTNNKQVENVGLNSEPAMIIGSAATGKRFTGRRISLEFKDADIHNLLRIISDVAKVNVITSDDVQGTITIRLINVPWDQALDIILKTKGLGMERHGGIIRVALLEALQKERELKMAEQSAKAKLEQLKVRIIPASYSSADELQPHVEGILSERGSLTIDKRTNVIIVKDILQNLVKAEQLVRKLDTPTPQVLIEARIVEAESKHSESLGVNWGTSYAANTLYGNTTGAPFPNSVLTSASVNLPAAPPQGVDHPPGAFGLKLGSISGSANVDLILSALEHDGKVDIISSPKIIALDNREAIIKQGYSIPVTSTSSAGTDVKYIDALLEVKVRPHITADGGVFMEVSIKKDEPLFKEKVAGHPAIWKNQGYTELLIKDNETKVIGGIYKHKGDTGTDKIPLLGDIPFFGWLFKTRSSAEERNELLIFLTPRILNRDIIVDIIE